MKQWKILIPSLVAVSAIPFVSMVGCNKPKPTPPQPEPEVEKFYVNNPIKEGDINYLYSNEITVIPHQDYDVIINVADFTTWPEGGQDKCSIWPSHLEEITAADIDVKSIYVGETEIPPDYSEDQPWYGFVVDETGGWIQIYNTPITSTSIITATFAFTIERAVRVSFTNKTMDI